MNLCILILSLVIVCLAAFGIVEGILIPVPRGTCELQFDTGPCDAYEPVWSYNAEIGGCFKAIYGGCGGNANRFPTAELCGILCFPENICNTPFNPGYGNASLTVWTHNPDSGVCETALYSGCGGNSNTFDTLEECTKYCQPRCVQDICQLKFDAGICKAYMPMWTFNSDKGVCEQAIYGGCGGNENRFKTKNDCINRCNPTDICELNFDSGICDAYIPVWTFNSTSKKCEKAVYGGCGGNSNRYKYKNQCIHRCNPKDTCELDFETGLCRAFIPVYTYNSTTGVCEKAVYGGCGGNDNKFETIEECNQLCNP